MHIHIEVCTLFEGSIRDAKVSTDDDSLDIEPLARSTGSTEGGKTENWLNIHFLSILLQTHDFIANT